MMGWRQLGAFMQRYQRHKTISPHSCQHSAGNSSQPHLAHKPIYSGRYTHSLTWIQCAIHHICDFLPDTVKTKAVVALSAPGASLYGSIVFECLCTGREGKDRWRDGSHSARSGSRQG